MVGGAPDGGHEIGIDHDLLDAVDRSSATGSARSARWLACSRDVGSP
jgi:hypothetical protein